MAPSDFNGNVVRVAIIEDAPYMMLNRDRAGRLHPTGYLIDLTQILAQELNFTIRWHETLDGEYGVPKANGGWTGMVGDLQMGRADIALGSISFTIPRSAVIDFSPAIEYSSLRILVLAEGEDKALDWSTYFAILHWHVWMALGGIWVAMGVGVVMVARSSPQLTVYNYLFSFAGAFAQQGSEVEPGCARGRLVFLSVWVGSVLVYTSYTARLTSQLAVVNTRPPFNTLLEALTTADYQIITQVGTSYITAMESSRDRGLQLLYSRIQADPSLLYKTDIGGLRRMVKSKRKVGLLQLQSTIDYLLKGNCSYTWVGQDYFTEYLYLGYRKGLSYANVLSAYIVRATDVGILPKLRAKWWGHGQANCGSATSFRELGFSKTISAFALLFVGGLVSVAFLVVEYFCHRFGVWRHLGKVFQSRGSRSKRRKKYPTIRDQQRTFMYQPHLRHLPHTHSPLSEISVY